MNIQLTRIHAINWFGYQDCFDIAGNLLIAGLTGSGKSILMDLIQLVLVGDQKSKYNQSATGKSSSRTLKSYCLGDTKDEIEGIPQYMRNEGATTFVALEFTWPDNKKVETWGIRIEFDSPAQTSPSRRNGFMLPRRMEKTDWCDEFMHPQDWEHFREYTHENRGQLFDTMEAYRREMAVTEHLNFDRETLDYLLPAAMSFTFLDNFNKFCRNYVLPPDEIQIQEVRDSYHAFLSLRRELTQLRQQLDLLKEIQTEFDKHNQSLLDKDLYADISRFLACEELREVVEEYEEEIKELEHKTNEENTRESKLDDLLNTGRAKRDILRDALNESAEGRLYLHIKDENKDLVMRLQQLRTAVEKIEEARQLRCNQIHAWMDRIFKAGVKIPVQVHKDLLTAVQQVQEGKTETLSSDLEHLSDTVRHFNEAYIKGKVPLMDEIEKKANKVKMLTQRLEQLDRGKINHRSTLLDTINQSLPRRANGEPAAFALRELCEVKDEKWRPALEIAFNRKFAIVVEPENYRYAEQIYREMKTAAPGESLINPQEALKLKPRRQQNSLAEHLECHDPIAQRLVDHLFGRLICVEKSSDLTKHDAAILPDGFSYRRPFAERRAHYDNVPCIGGRGLQQQKKKLLQERAKLRDELENATPIINLLQQAEQLFRKERLDSPSLGSALTELSQLQDYEQRLNTNIQRLKTIEAGDFEQKEIDLRELDLKIAGYEAELKALRQSKLKIDLGKVQGSLEDAKEKLEKAELELSRYRAEGPDRSDQKNRRIKLLEELLSEFHAYEIAKDQARRLERLCSEQALTSWRNAVESRKELAREFPSYNEFAPEDTSNAPWQERLERISNSDIPNYESKAEREEYNWQEIFRKQVLIKLRSALLQVDITLMMLNKELKQPIGYHLYQIRKKRNPDYSVYHKLVDNNSLAEDDGLFFENIDAETREEVERLFNSLVEDPNDSEALNFLDYRNYFDYDMSVNDTRNPKGRETSVDKQSGKFSGGESQSPYFIAILACYLRAYHRYHSQQHPSIGLVPIDEAFSKLSGERIRDCISALKSLGLQGTFSMSSGNIPYAIDLCDQTMVVSKKETRKEDKTHIRNIAISLTREAALKQLVQE